MKIKTILITIFSILSLVTAAQNVGYMRAFTFNIGAISNGEITWLGEKPTNALVELHENKIVVYSNEVQIYRIIKLTNSDSESSIWEVVDNYGSIVNLALSFIPDSDARMLMIIYEDVAWYYVLYRE